MRGTPHVHSLVCIAHDGISQTSVESEDTEEQNKVKELIKKVVSANLVDRVVTHEIEVDVDLSKRISSEEKDFNWNPDKCYFDDNEHPSRIPFNSSWIYERNEKGDFMDKNVQNQYRDIQISAQMHRCCQTCFKYCSAHDQICRFGFPWTSRSCEFEPIIRKDRDKKSRIRVTVLPQRNNANLNGTLYDPLITIAHGGNHDIQYISNSVGAAEYVASYASKAEEPDKRQMANIYAKKISYIEGLGTHVTDRQRLYAVGSAILGSSPVGAVQACYALLGLKFVKSSRQVVNVNPLNRKSMYHHYCMYVFQRGRK
jgi:hypothetical protein